MTRDYSKHDMSGSRHDSYSYDSLAQCGILKIYIHFNALLSLQIAVN